MKLKEYVVFVSFIIFLSFLLYIAITQHFGENADRVVVVKYLKENRFPSPPDQIPPKFPIDKITPDKTPFTAKLQLPTWEPSSIDSNVKQESLLSGVSYATQLITHIESVSDDLLEKLSPRISEDVQETQEQFTATGPSLPMMEGAQRVPIEEPPRIPTSKPSSSTSENVPPVAEPFAYECCNAHKTNTSLFKNVLFLKTHKCGSTTVQNILFRFGLDNNLDFMLPRFFYYIAYDKELTQDNLMREAGPSNGIYNILNHHTKYTPDYKKFMYPDTIAITILRDPAEVFEATYTYFQLQVVTGLNFADFMRKTSVEQKSVWTIDPQGAYYGHNQMSYDLGLPMEQFHDELAIHEYINFLDNEFHFVMIAEHFQESLVLLAHQMNWPLDYVTSIPMNQRSGEKKHPLTEEDRLTLYKVNYADTLIYAHFRQKFEKCLQQFGTQRMAAEVRKLNELNQALRKKCVLRENSFGLMGTVGYDLKKPFDPECIYSTKNELMFTDELRFKQTQKQIFKAFNARMP